MTTGSRLFLLLAFSFLKADAAASGVVKRVEPVALSGSAQVSEASEAGLLFLLGSGFIAAGMVRRSQRVPARAVRGSENDVMQ